jgi:restriction system protein
MTTRGADGGVDIRLFQGQSTSTGIIVQCKSWNTYKVGVAPIRELFGVMASEGVSEGIFVTTSVFTNEAKEFARGKALHLIDGGDLLQDSGSRRR